MATITISKNLIKNDDLIVLPRKEYESMKMRMFPVFELKGKKAKNLDERVNEGIKEYNKGETGTLESFLKEEYPGFLKK
ncbi:MAG: hypothetical protein NT098_01050 [Candidatus Parcubacteria bacterium]|nr:hypothetical protein [Candidatus Parcubacteria bacterium]